jgi:Domain of unknown function (DUF5011)
MQHRLKLFVRFSLILLLLAPTRGSGAATVQVSVPANQAWTDTGIDLTLGSNVTITASGTIKIASSDPGKTPAGAPECSAPSDFVAPGLPCWSLIGRIGGGTPFYVGTAMGFSVTTSGRLFLGVNDNSFPDNTGSWTATVTVTVTSQAGQSPVITLLGDNPLLLTQGCPLVGAGATASDPEDGDLTNSIIIDGSAVDINTPGQYFLTYSVTDSGGLSDTETRQVIVSGVIGTPVCSVGFPAGKAPNLVVLVHGCCTNADDVRNDWDSLGKIIAGAIQTPAAEQWEIVVWDWSRFTPKHAGIDFQDVIKDARTAYDNTVTHPDEVYLNLKDAIAKHPYKHVHLLGHSAGSNLIQLTAEELVRIYTQRNENPFIHLTFFDAFTLSVIDKNTYGFLPNNYQNHYSEHYVHRGFAFMDISTDECLLNAFNFDITNWAHPPEEDGILGHSWPRNWYERSVTSTSPKFKYGLPLSLEGSGKNISELVNELTKYPAGQQCDLSTLFNENPDCQPAACWQ